jgi:hypothetical protein
MGEREVRSRWQRVRKRGHAEIVECKERKQKAAEKEKRIGRLK